MLKTHIGLFNLAFNVYRQIRLSEWTYVHHEIGASRLFYDNDYDDDDDDGDDEGPPTQ